MREEIGFGHPWALGDAGDSLANELILRRLRSERPGDAVLSEEAHDDLVRLQSDRVWIIDPLDGTREFSTPGRDDWAVHIALWQRPTDGQREITDAAVSLPARGNIVYRSDTVTDGAARVGIPHTLRIAVSATRPPARAAPDTPRAGHSAGGDRVGGCQSDGDHRRRGSTLSARGWSMGVGFGGAAGVVMAAGMHASRLDGSPMRYKPARPVSARLRDVSLRAGSDPAWCHPRRVALARRCTARIAPLAATRLGGTPTAGLKSRACSRGLPQRCRRCRDAAPTFACMTPRTGKSVRWRLVGRLHVRLRHNAL